MSNTRRLKARLLQEAVEDNVATINGRLPKPLRRSHRLKASWAPQSAAALIFLAVLGVVRVASGTGTAAAPATAPATVVLPEQPAAAAPRPVASAPESYSRPQPVNVSALALAVRRVIIDAGHGGASLGTASTSGLLEKDVTLDIAQRLQTRVSGKGLTALMTRAGDDTVSLLQRSTIANDAEGDIFVSIHVNSLAPKSRGIETFYLGPSEAPGADAIAAHENRDSGYSLADLRSLLDRIYTDARRGESKRLAQSVQRALVRNVRRVTDNVEDRGVKTAPFVVLVGTNMPAILAEVSCLSNKEEAALLNGHTYRQSIADALFEGIQAYLREGAIEGRSKETGNGTE
jgi:N-acetylmuramoyl-L-alanine amidase